MRDYLRAIRLNPSYALAYYNAANIYFFNRQFKQASEVVSMSWLLISSSIPT